MGVFLGHCHVGVGEHLAHSLDTHAFCQRPRCKRVAAYVHCQVDVQTGKVGDYLQLVVAFLVAHQIEVVVVLFQYGYRLRQQHNRIGHTGFHTLVSYAVVLALPEHVRLLDLHKVGVRQPCEARDSIE